MHTRPSWLPRECRVLVIEDDARSADLLRAAFEGSGADTVAVVPSAVAIEAAGRVRPDVVVAGVPVEPAADVVDAIARLRDQCEAAVIYLTAEFDPMTLARLRALHPDAVLTKPCRDADLLAAVDLAWQRQRWASGLLRDRRLAEDALRRVQADLRQAQKMEAVGRLSGGVAHDFNNLLTIISSDAEILLEEPLSAAQHALATEMRHTVNRAVALTRQLMTFSRKEPAATVTTDLNELVGSAVSLMHRLLPENITLVESLCRTRLPVRVDAGQFESVVLNLGTNARDAMPAGGTLSVSTRLVRFAGQDPDRPADLSPGTYAALTVQDSGAGIDDATRDRIFEPFFTTKARDSGTGLGLATVYNIVRQSGGHVVVESQLSRGSLFTVYVPAWDSDVDIDGPAPSAADEAPRGRETILLVEDDPRVRSLSVSALSHLGYRVLEGADGPDGLRVSAGHAGRIDVLVTDVVMPGLGGRDLAERLRADRPGMVVLFMSGYGDEDAAAQGLVPAGATVLQKPFTPRTLARSVREALDRTRPT